MKLSPCCTQLFKSGFTLSLEEETYSDGAKLSFLQALSRLTDFSFLSDDFKHLKQVSTLSHKHWFGIISRSRNALLITFYTTMWCPSVSDVIMKAIILPSFLLFFIVSFSGTRLFCKLLSKALLNNNFSKYFKKPPYKEVKNEGLVWLWNTGDQVHTLYPPDYSTWALSNTSTRTKAEKNKNISWLYLVSL